MAAPRCSSPWRPSASSSRLECGSSNEAPPGRAARRHRGRQRGAAVGKRIVVNAGLTETRVAVQEASLLTELSVGRHGRRSIVGSVHKGSVTNVLPGMQAAFVDIGLTKDAFLYAGDYTANVIDDVREADTEGAAVDEDLDAEVDEP